MKWTEKIGMLDDHDTSRMTDQNIIEYLVFVVVEFCKIVGRCPGCCKMFETILNRLTELLNSVMRRKLKNIVAKNIWKHRQKIIGRNF